MATEEEIWKKVSELTPQEVVAFLNALGDSKCPSCGTNDFALGSYEGVKTAILSLPFINLDEKGVADTTTRSLPVFCSACNNCGFMALHSCFHLVKSMLEKSREKDHNE